jgi:sulfoxide reductase heme-binding subunit YedZ
MGHAYQAVGWNRQKKLYDLTLLGLVLLAASVAGTLTAVRHPGTTVETFVIRFTSVSALLLLHVILAIGPLARLDGRFLPLLYNRRHLGVTMALFSLVHGVFAIVQFHGLGDINPIVSVFTAYGRDYALPLTEFRSVSQFPFEAFGFAALLILLLMAATSHDFWLRHLGASVWKALHQLVYLAYGLVLAHVLFGALQSERSTVYPVLLGAGFVGVLGLHLFAARRERKLDSMRAAVKAEGFHEVAKASGLIENEGRVVVVEGKRYALFLREGKVHALSNVCRHQGGPIGEGRIVNGCVTCPWHGFQYKVDDGCSPPPFSEVLPTYPVRVIGDTVYLSLFALPMRTVSEGAAVQEATKAKAQDATGGTASAGAFYIGWQSRCAPALAVFTRRAAFGLSLLVPLVVSATIWFQHPVDRGRFEFGVVRDFEGVLLERPVPRLRVALPDGAMVDHVLVGQGKFGPPASIQGKDGRRVRVRGTFIVREPLRMIEVISSDGLALLDPVTESVPSTPKDVAAVALLGTGSFTGELVDTKCYTGVMRPATGKVHRACAIRCLSGGVPPGLLVRDGRGDAVVFLLAGPGDEPFQFDVQMAGTLIEVIGRLELHGDTPVLRATSLRRK